MKKVFVVHGYWNTLDDDGVVIVKITEQMDEAIDSIKQIADSKAKEFVQLRGFLSENLGDTHYEVNGGNGYAKFYVVEQVINSP